MPACEEAIYSENVYDYITDYPIENTGDLSPVFCYAKVDEKYNIAYVDKSVVPNPETNFLDYPNQPKLYGILDNEGARGEYAFQPKSLQEAGIMTIQQGSLGLTGRGVILCFIDTGIDYRSPVFQTISGQTRILAIWDQTARGGEKPEGFLYGTQYTREQINEALASQNPYEVVPHKDTSGHGTALASAGAGTRLENPAFLGAAPECDILVVKLKPAKQYLRDFYMVPDETQAYQENDIMLAVQYCEQYAVLLQRPVVICLGLGCGLGGHRGRGFLSEYISQVAAKRSRCVVIAGGNEGNGAHHFEGELARNKTVELNVSQNHEGFLMEVWGRLPDLVTFTLVSPGGESLPRIRIQDGRTVTYGFVFEETQVTVDAALIEPGSGEQLIRLRFVRPTQGIWRFEMESANGRQSGKFDFWLPSRAFLTAPAYFLQPDPYITITEPGYAENAVTVAFYNAANGALSADSGRGYGANNQVKPDLAAPGVAVSTIRGPITGSGVAAALTAGAVALFFQWAVVQGNNRLVGSREIKSFLLLGASREERLSYPNREWGYGRINLQKSFDILAKS